MKSGFLFLFLHLHLYHCLVRSRAFAGDAFLPPFIGPPPPSSPETAEKKIAIKLARFSDFVNQKEFFLRKLSGKKRILDPFQYGEANSHLGKTPFANPDNNAGIPLTGSAASDRGKMKWEEFTLEEFLVGNHVLDDSNIRI